MEIYLDNAATMPLWKSALKEMQPFFFEKYGNPSSLHALGSYAKSAILRARKELALEIGVRTEEIIFTGSATEANAMALLGTAADAKGKKKIIISSIEHSSVYENAQLLSEKGFDVIEIPVSEEDGLNLTKLEEALDKNTVLVSIVLVNSETGIINNISRIGKMCKSKGVLLHVDAVQGFGKIKIQAKSWGIDFLTVGAHKIGGPKGVGFLYIRQGASIKPLFEGGSQERRLRAGTENVPGIIGFAASLREYKKINWNKVEENRNLLEKELVKLGARVTGSNLERSKGHLHVCFKKVDGEEILNYLSTKGIYCSTGSACDFGNKEKRVLSALHIPEDYQKGALRFTLSGNNSEKEMLVVAKEIGNFLKKKNRNF